MMRNAFGVESNHHDSASRGCVIKLTLMGRCPGLMNGCLVGAEDLRPVARLGLSALKGRQFVSPGQRPGLRRRMNETRTARVRQWKTWVTISLGKKGE
jgi:hypothetical protein